MEMLHGLAAVGAGVYRNAVALGQAFEPGDFACRPEQVAEQGAIFGAGFSQRGNVFARHHQHMHRRLRVQVRKSVAELVLVNRRRGNDAFSDLAKEATHSESSVQEWSAAPNIGLAGMDWVCLIAQ